MTVTYETSIQDFDFWGQAKELVSRLTRAELEMIEEMLEETYPVISKTELNDIFAFYWDSAIMPIIGISEEQILEREPF